jgi:hypothetical protein
VASPNLLNAKRCAMTVQVMPVPVSEQRAKDHAAAVAKAEARRKEAEETRQKALM